MSHSTISTGSRPMRAALVQRRTDARTGIPRRPWSISTTRPPMNPPAPVTRIGRSDDNTGSRRHRVEPRHGKALTPAIALLDHGDGREYLPRRHGRRSLAAHRSQKIGDHVVSYAGERAHLRPQPHLARTPAAGQADRVPGQDAALQCALVSHDSKGVRQLAQPAQVDHTAAALPRELDPRDGLTAPHGIILVPRDARPRAEPPADHVQRVGTHILKHPFAGSRATEHAPARQGPVERRAALPDGPWWRGSRGTPAAR